MSACPGCGDELVEGKVVCDDCVEEMQGGGDEEDRWTDEDWEMFEQRFED